LPLIRAELQRRRLPRPGPLIHDLSQVLYLPFDHDDGSYARDRSGYNNHGIIYGATIAAGKIGMARSFDGVDDYIEVAHSPSLYLDGDFTVLAWASIDRIPPGYCGVIDKGRGTFDDFYFLSMKGASRFLWGIAFTDKTALEQVFPTVNLGELNFYAFGVEGSNMFMSLNGAPKTTLAFTKTREIDTKNLTLGCWNIITAYEKITLDEVRIYHRALSQAEYTRIMYLRGI